MVPQARTDARSCVSRFARRELSGSGLCESSRSTEHGRREERSESRIPRIILRSSLTLFDVCNRVTIRVQKLSGMPSFDSRWLQLSSPTLSLSIYHQQWFLIDEHNLTVHSRRTLLTFCRSFPNSTSLVQHLCGKIQLLSVGYGKRSQLLRLFSMIRHLKMSRSERDCLTKEPGKKELHRRE